MKYCFLLLLATLPVAGLWAQPVFTGYGVRHLATDSVNDYRDTSRADIQRVGVPGFSQADNYYQLTAHETYDRNIAARTVPAEYQSNPDFGTLPFSTGCTDCYEELQERTETQRTFRSISDPTLIYLQASGMPINYQQNGQWIAIDPRLTAAANGKYTADHQPCPTGLDVPNKKSTLTTGAGQLGFNHLSLSEYDANGNATVYNADWDNYTVGDNGIYVHGVFPGIDMTIQYMEGKVKSNLILLAPRPNSARMVFSDSLDLPAGCSIANGMGEQGEDGWKGGMYVQDANGGVMFMFSRIVMYDNSPNDAMSWLGQYTFSGNVLRMHVNADAYNNPYATYPFIIDPAVTYGPSAAPTNAVGTLLTPAFCTQSLVVSVPGGATPVDFTSTWQIQAANFGCCATFANCRLSWAQVYLTSSCGGVSPTGAPGSVWTCTPGCNVAGTWTPTLPYGTNPGMATCIPASCSAQNITFTLNLNRTSCSNNSGCNCTWATNYCVYLNSWNLTIQARTAETLGNTATGNGTANVTGNCCLNTLLNPAAQYGVPPYSYSWSTGSTASTINVNSCANGTTGYTCTVTDACGTARTATFSVNVSDCVLPVELLYFSGSYEDDRDRVRLRWATATEVNNDYFLVERTMDGITFTPVGRIASGARDGNSTSELEYELFDVSPPEGNVYYRLTQYDYSGQRKDGGTVSVLVGRDKASALSIQPNPAEGTVSIGYTSQVDAASSIQLIDYSGRVVQVVQCASVAGTNQCEISVAELPQGFYFVQLTTGSEVMYGKLIKK